MAPKTLSAVLIAALVTLVITGVRLGGELLELDSSLFSRAAGGGGSPLGAVWLVPFAGFWFGRRLAASGSAPTSIARPLTLCLLGVGVLIGALVWIVGLHEGEELSEKMIWFPVAGGFAALLAAIGWGRAFVANLLYGILARVPVVIVQFVGIANEWGTHYEKVHPKMPPMTADERGFGLMMAQLTMWIPFTIVVGGIFAVFGAKTVRGK